MFNFLNKNLFFSKNKFDFRKDLSTEHSLFKVDNCVRKNIENNFKVMGIFSDVYRAFNSVNHEILLKKLYIIGIHETSNNLI